MAERELEEWRVGVEQDEVAAAHVPEGVALDDDAAGEGGGHVEETPPYVLGSVGGLEVKVAVGSLGS